MAENKRAGRARQFLPFASLRGYYDLIAETERVVQPRRARTPEENEMLSRKLLQVRKGMIIEVVHYRDGAYERLEGMVAHIDLVLRTITIVKTTLSLDALYDIRGEDISEEF